MAANALAEHRLGAVHQVSGVDRPADLREPARRVLNLIIRHGQGTGDITRPYIQKFFDRLASSTFSYLAVDSDLRLIEYGEVGWSEVKASTCTSSTRSSCTRSTA